MITFIATLVPLPFILEQFEWRCKGASSTGMADCIHTTFSPAGINSRSFTLCDLSSGRGIIFISELFALALDCMPANIIPLGG